MVLGHIRNSLSHGSERTSMDEQHRGGDDGGESGDETVVSSEQGSVLSHIISQLRPGADLSRVTLPTFILEPRSMLERITNFMAHPEFLLKMPTIEDPVERFVAVTKFYLSGWHIKPPGVKKPLNPVLGEIFTGYWDYSDNTRGYYISEQTSHHPPKSSYFFMAPEHHIRIDGTLKPRSKFLGNSVGSFMEGIAIMRFTERGERYFITQPNMYARGILFGKMVYELGDQAVVRCPESGLEADIEFKVKGWMGGTYNAIGGHIKETKTGKNLYEISGFWHGKMYLKDLATGKKEMIFDATHAKPSFPKSRPLEEQGPKESQKLWHTTTEAIKKSDQKTATDDKSRIEDEQRKEREERGGDANWKPKLFRPIPAGDEENLDWIIDAEVDDKAPIEKQIEQILAIAPILPGSRSKSESEQGSQQPQKQETPASARQPEQPAQAQEQPAQPQLQQAQPAAPSAKPAADGGDLIDVGQNDGASDGMAGPGPLPPIAQLKKMDIQQGNIPPSAQTSIPRDAVRRLDSMGNEEIFRDAES